ncbi:MAG TPA: hypothetical protein VK466_08660 [Terriglobales bacterium]|nr:hypothetical protein [Terriglobales bacterium]
MNRSLLSICLVVLCAVSLTVSAVAQKSDAGATAKSSDPNALSEGFEGAGYRIHQAIEVGYRVTDTTGSNAMYETLVDLHTGARVLEQSLSMQAIEHQGMLFDNLSVNSYGWGGDPENGLRARFEKNRWYDFRGSFRRDLNRFDFNLLANPLNPSTSNPNLPVDFSPHLFATTRRMTDLDLTLFPRSLVSLRLGYSHNNMNGDSFSSVHEGTDALLYQPWNTTLNSYRIGADLKLLPNTVLSYDQFLDYYKGDNTWSLAPFASAMLSDGSSVELGLPFDTANKVPCAPPAGQGLVDANGNLTNIACGAYFDYSRSNRVRTSTLTERLSLHGNYFGRLELNAAYSCSSSHMNAPLNEFFNGLLPRTYVRQFTVTGPGEATRISNVADFDATIRLTKHLRLMDTFRFWAYRVPESFTSTETDWAIQTSGTCKPPACSLLVPLSATTQKVTATPDALSFNQDWKRNEFALLWDGSKHFGGRVGFRYGTRLFHHVDFTADEAERVEIHEYTPLLGMWFKPAPNLRISFDGERTSNDQTLVRIGARREGLYRVQTSYSPKPWANIGGSINLWDGANGGTLTDYRGHNRNYGFSTTLLPQGRFGFDFAYDYGDYQQNALICFNDLDTSLTVVSQAGTCTAGGYSDTANPLLTDGHYDSTTHYGMASLQLRPVKRVRSQLGYSLTSIDGSTPQFNQLQPSGSLRYNFHQPLANLEVDLGHNLAAKMGWNYSQYGEKSFVGPTGPRYFHGNNATFGLRWAF